jgi:hypothetical protein
MEPEAVAGAVNLLHILEHGRDLRGRRWPEIRRLEKRLRLLLVPLANPDGRARVRIPSLVGLTSDDHSFYAQGMWKDGRLITWLGSKQFIPLPLMRSPSVAAIRTTTASISCTTCPLRVAWKCRTGRWCASGIQSKESGGVVPEQILDLLVGESL